VITGALRYHGAVPRPRIAFALAALIGATVVAGRGPGAATAQPAPGAAAPGDAARKVTIALLPFTAERRLAVFGQPVASEISRALREAGLDVSLVGDGAPVPARARLVVSGRIVKRGAGVVLEARIRDPERGVDVARPSGAAAAVADIDQAASALATALVPAIRGGLAAQDAAAARDRAALAPPPAPVPVATGVVQPARPVAVDRRPVALVTVQAPTLADRDGAPMPVATLAAPAVADLARRVGYRAVAVDAHAAVDPAVLASSRAALRITVELLSLSHETSRDIPLGRARARVTVTDASGAPVYRRTVRTDTLVGSRGDRLDTLVRLAAAQVTDVIAPRLRERLAARRP